MATSGQGIWAPLGTGSVRDYSHAAQIFRTNDFARTPKSKYLFYVSFTINPTATANGFTSPISPIGDNELSYLVKNVEMPKFEIDVQDLNQYNKKVIVQRSIKYNPVTIKFHDDNTGSLRNFWASYYNYYYNDGRDGVDFSVDDKYKTRKQSRWGFDTNNTAPYLSKIEIYSMYHSEAQKITLQNPIISNFSHDTHDYSEGQGLLEASMTLHYTGVTYEDGIDASHGIPGFGQAAPETYDTEYSDITTGAGLQVDPKTGQLYDPTQFTVPSIRVPSLVNALLGKQTYAYNNYNPTAPNYVTNRQLSSILQNASSYPPAAGYLFPTANTQSVVYEDFGAVPLGNGITISDGAFLNSPGELDNLYDPSSWQQSMYQKGYTPDEIAAAQDYVTSVNLPPGSNIQQTAEVYITNSSSEMLYNAQPVFGQPASVPTLINFSNPISTTQPIYNSLTWQSRLSSQGYTKSEIATANRYLSTLKIKPGADLTSIAANYINHSKQTGATAITAVTLEFANALLSTVSNIEGPNFNPVTGISDTGVGPIV